MSMQIKNYMEEFVTTMVKQHMKNIDVCQCEACRLDLMAIVLNAIPPKYVVTPKGEMYTKINLLTLQYEIDVITEITKAAKIVKAFPRHDQENNDESNSENNDGNKDEN